jgi:hypothetical protein
MTTKSLATQQRATTGITPRAEVAQEIMLREQGDEDFRFQMRKLGNLHLGVKAKNQSGKEYPKATEYFVLPDDLRNDPDLREKFNSMGQDADKPKRLPVMLMSDNIGANVVTSCDLYGMSGKLKCRSYDGRFCQRLNERTSTYETMPCKQGECPDFCKGDCAWYHRIRCLIPDAAGIGYWQIATKSDNNRGALVREMFDLRKTLRGRLAGIDLILALTNEREFHVKPKNGDKMITTRPYLLHLEAGASLRKLMNATRQGDVYDADQIEESFDFDAEPEAESDFPVGEPVIEADPDTGEVVDAEIVDDELARLRSQCVDMANSLELTPTRIKVLCTMASKPNNKGAIMELTAEECGYFAQLCGDADSKQAKLI